MARHLSPSCLRFVFCAALLGASGCRYGFEHVSEDLGLGGSSGDGDLGNGAGGLAGSGSTSGSGSVPGSGSVSGSGSVPGSGSVSGSGGSTSGDGGQGSGGDPGDGGGASGGAASGGTAAGGAASGGSDSGGSGSGGADPGPPTLAPIPSFTVTPGARRPGESFSLDASATTDSEDATMDLTFEWDFDGNGSIDSSGMTLSHSFGSPGYYTITLRVTDTSGASATTSRIVAVSGSSDLVIVNTASTTVDGTSPASPGADGVFSLREAISYVNGQAGAQVIQVEQGLTIPLVEPIQLNGAGGDSLVGYGATINGEPLNGSSDCLLMSSAGGVVAGLTFVDCSNRGIEVLASNITVSNVTIVGGTAGIFVTGGVTGVTLGPGNNISYTSSYGLHLSGPADFIGSRIADTGGSGILLLSGASGSLIFQNQILRSGQFNIDLANQVTSATIAHNVLHASAVHSIGLGSSSAASIDNNAITSAAMWGIPVNPSGLISLRGNLFGNNGSGACACTLDPSNLETDPGYVNAAGDDFRPSLTSSLLENGILTGLDTNDVLGAGNYNGTAPDIGYYEATAP